MRLVKYRAVNIIGAKSKLFLASCEAKNVARAIYGWVEEVVE